MEEKIERIRDEIKEIVLLFGKLNKLGCQVLWD